MGLPERASERFEHDASPPARFGAAQAHVQIGKRDRLQNGADAGLMGKRQLNVTKM
jgi:hypothetical protein